MIEENSKLEQKVEHIMFTKWQMLIGILAFLIPVIGFFTKLQIDNAVMKEQIKIIQTNELVHIQSSLIDLQNKMSTHEEKNNVDVLEIKTSLAKIEAILSK